FGISATVWDSGIGLGFRHTVLENANAGDFDDAVKCDIYKAQMGGKYLPVSALDPYNRNTNINTPATLRAWMRSKYQCKTGSVADTVTPTGIDAFFTQLKDMWLECAPNLNGGQNYQSTSLAKINKLNCKIAFLEAQLVQPIQAQSQNNDVLEDLSKKYSQMVNMIKKLAQHKCSNCGKAGHNSHKCSRKKKNFSSEPESETDINVNISKTKKKVKKESNNPSSLPKRRDQRITSLDDQSRLEKIIEKIIKKVLNKKLGNTTTLQLQNSASKMLVNSLKGNKDNHPSNFQKATPETSDSDGEDEILNKPI
ncbi:hypothetical protein C1645_829125, partial [Glomus cerebriforme]